MPILVIDTLRLSNRLVGPLVRLRDGMRRLARGEHVAPIHFRTGDFMEDLALEFNKVAEFADRKTLTVFPDALEDPSEQHLTAV